MGLFGKSVQKTPKEQCREWTGKLRKQGYQLDREISKIEQGEFKVKQEIKQAAKRGDKDVIQILAKELVRSRKAKSRLHSGKSQIGSLSMIINEQMGTVQVAGALQKSTEAMRYMQNLVSITNISNTMQELSREMMKTGIIGEMMDEAIESAIEDEPIEDEVKEEVDKIMSELNLGTSLKLSEAAKPSQIQVPASKVAAEKDDDYIAKMTQRLEGLKN